MAETSALFTPVTVSCVFRCRHTESGFDPVPVHAAMEAHYRDGHQDDIAAALTARRSGFGWVTGQ